MEIKNLAVRHQKFITKNGDLFALGLQPPDGVHEHEEGIDLTEEISKRARPSQWELELSRKTHRWKDINKIMNDFLLDIATELAEFYNDVTALWKIPGIEAVRRSLKSEKYFEDNSRGTFKYTDQQFKRYVEIVRDLEEDLIGTREVKKQAGGIAGVPIFNYWLLAAFSKGVDKIFDQIKAEAPPEVDMDWLMTTKVMPNFENRRYRLLIEAAGDRLRAELSKKYVKKVRSALLEMADQGKTPLQAARYMYRDIGVGDAWWWRRIARSESTLAIDAAFSEQAALSNVTYEEWWAAPNACWICSGLNGNMWKINEGPHPVADTHPHCLCLRSPRYSPKEGQPVREKWDRPSPYDQPYTKDERTKFIEEWS